MVAKSATIGSMRETQKAIRAELSDKRRVVALSKVHGSNVLHEDIWIMNLEGLAAGSERDDMDLLISIRLDQNPIYIYWKQFRFAWIGVLNDNRQPRESMCRNLN